MMLLGYPLEVGAILLPSGHYTHDFAYDINESDLQKFREVKNPSFF